MFNKKKIETDNHLESITLSLSDFKEKYYNECSQHAVTLNKLNELTVVSSAMEKIVDSYEIALDPKKVENMKINFELILTVIQTIGVLLLDTASSEDVIKRGFSVRVNLKLDVKLLNLR